MTFEYISFIVKHEEDIYNGNQIEKNLVGVLEMQVIITIQSEIYLNNPNHIKCLV